jgi:hypothetical protein
MREKHGHSKRPDQNDEVLLAMNDIGRCVLMRIQSPTATATANPADTNMLLWESEISRAAERALINNSL